MVRKSVIVLLVAICCIASAFASNQVKTSVSPYSFQRISSSSSVRKPYNADYGYGMKFAYLHSFNNGVTYGIEAGIFDYYLPEFNKNGNCVECPVHAKFGYYSPENRNKILRYFVLSDVGFRVLHVTDRTNGNFSLGVEVGLSKKIGRGFCLVLSAEPEWSFSEQTKSNDDFTDFVCTVNLGLGYNF